MADPSAAIGVSKSPMRVHHFGNTANNAFYNVAVLRQYAGIESEMPIAMLGMGHAMSAPAWEAVDFEVPNTGWVANPDWSAFPEAANLNAEYSDLPRPSSADDSVAPLPTGYRFTGFLPGARRSLNAWLGGQSWARPLVDYRSRQWFARRPVLSEPDGEINVLYGGDSLTWQRIQEPSARTVSFEHGTIRWVGDGDDDGQGERRRAYREQVQASRHLWVTNLDPRTLEIAEDLMPGRWSALPHPYLPDSRVPFPESAMRRELLERTRSDALILLPSSQNWKKDHDKGSIKALRAFVELRRAGWDVGLVAVEWGNQLAESKALFESEGVSANVVWVAPMARFGLQRMMANVDVVWDQFGLEAFGGLAQRAVEQGTPLVSRGLAPVGEELIGGPVPWLDAAETDDIVRQTVHVLEEMGRSGRERVIEQTRARYRTWLFERHGAGLTAALQSEMYEKMVDGSFDPGTAVPDRWSRILKERSRQDG
jgi:hypothetical protein